MKISAKLFSVLIILFIASGCEKDNSPETETYTIKFGSECGWCGGQEYVTISANKVEYNRNIPCGENKGEVTKSKVLTGDEWQQIINAFDYSLFKTLKYNQCNVCVDGCDEIIQITENEFLHELRYTPSEEVEGMGNLIQLLTTLLVEMREQS